ncbi:hypothetical protein Poly24_16660 [Rosistilla carotiformis]|uniref:Uncharacterized protein n=1 Tax=Rosistilla carotiformis TaxID=2528017 RepID=A0A518JQZ1_9BACT|nr:hypothetical protein [Rosistilla carotiformis]QDV67960.1 hypothetical protein Poly24_16660 [Rosistilla carotiformis]
MTFNKQTGLGLTLLALSMVVGCGSSSTPVAENDASKSPATAPAPKAAVDMTPAANVVSQFLDAMRRGGSDTESLSLVTTKAREEFRRTGLVMQPIGSPDAKFDVTRSESVPGQSDAALVHSNWTEPSASGEPQSFEVVWAVQQEAGAWKISGLVIGQATGDAPIVVDFENGNDLAAMFQPQASPAGQQTTLQATAPAADSGVPLDTEAPVIR